MTGAWDQDDEHRRADIEHALDRMRRDHEDAVLAAAAAAPDLTDVPMPNTAHPAFPRYAVKGARAILETAYRDGSAFRVPEIRRPLVATFTPEPYPTHAAVGVRTFTVSRCHAPAPFIGDPRTTDARYLWRVATDELGRTITTDATLIYRPDRVTPR